MKCIFCNNENKAKSIEHIVSESLGNTTYLMTRGAVCDECNSKFSKFEAPALTKSILHFERAKMAVSNKRGKNAKGKIKELQVEGDTEFRKNILNIKGLSEINFKDFDPTTGTGKLIVASFDGTEVPVSKLLLKMALESIYTSRRKLYNKYDFTHLREFLLDASNKPWPFIMTRYEQSKFESIPRYSDKYNLGRTVSCELKFCELDDKTLLFKFKYGAIPMVINLLSRDTGWMQQVVDSDDKAQVYPEHFRKRLTLPSV